MFETRENISKEIESLIKDMNDRGKNQILEVKNTQKRIFKNPLCEPNRTREGTEKRLLTLI